MPVIRAALSGRRRRSLQSIFLGIQQVSFGRKEEEEMSLVGANKFSLLPPSPSPPLLTLKSFILGGDLSARRRRRRRRRRRPLLKLPETDLVESPCDGCVWCGCALFPCATLSGRSGLLLLPSKPRKKWGEGGCCCCCCCPPPPPPSNVIPRRRCRCRRCRRRFEAARRGERLSLVVSWSAGWQHCSHHPPHPIFFFCVRAAVACVCLLSNSWWWCCHPPPAEEEVTHPPSHPPLSVTGRRVALSFPPTLCRSTPSPSTAVSSNSLQ